VSWLRAAGDARPPSDRIPLSVVERVPLIIEKAIPCPVGATLRRDAWSGTRAGSICFCVKQPSHDEDLAVSRLNTIGAAIAVLALATLPATAQQATQEPTAPPASTAPEPAQGPPPSPQASSPPTPSSPPTGVVATTNNPNLAVATLRLENGVRVSKIIGESVQNDQNQHVGKVDDLIVTSDDKITIAIVSVGGFLGMGDKLVAVPWQQLKAEGDHLVLPGASKDTMSAAPNFRY
jgi:sporulation protein YlmC with PRC-barrel domain